MEEHVRVPCHVTGDAMSHPNQNSNKVFWLPPVFQSLVPYLLQHLDDIQDLGHEYI